MQNAFARSALRGGAATAGALLVLAGASVLAARGADIVLTGPDAFGDWTKDAPGVWRKIVPGDLPAPFASQSVRNNSTLVPRPADAQLRLPPGFSVTAFVRGLVRPRVLKTAPNGDIFLAEVGTGKIRIIRAGTVRALAADLPTFADGLDRPFGIAFYPLGPNPRYVYVGTTKQIVRFPYHTGDLKAGGPAETIVANIPDGTHITRDVLFTPDGTKLLVSIGSGSNVQDKGPENEAGRANIIEYNPDGSGRQLYAAGLRNPVSIAFDPQSGDLWTCVNERDLLGDNLPPDYVTHVQRSAFYGWPYFYIGGHPDTRPVGGTPPVPPSGVTVPDVLIQPHSAPLGIAFYEAAQFPTEYHGDLFVALHGSWNRANRTGYKIVRLKMQNGKATGAYVDFLTGFVAPGGQVWGRPVSLLVAPDGALLMSDDGSGTVWRISYPGAAKTARR